MEIKFARIKDVKMPVRGTAESAGIDFFVPNDFETITIKNGEDVKIQSGIKCKMPKNTALIAFNKSGVALKGLSIGAKVIDEDYMGEISIHVYNRSNNDVTINPGDKLVQFINLPVIYSIPTEVDESELFDTITERGEGGFGSTGTR